MQKNKADNVPACLDDAVDLAVWILKTVATFSREYKYSLGARLVDEALNLTQAVQAASFNWERLEALAEANRRVNFLNLLLRMAVEVKQISHRQHAFAMACTVSVGNQVGGWRKSAKYEAAREPFRKDLYVGEPNLRRSAGEEGQTEPARDFGVPAEPGSQPSLPL